MTASCVQEESAAAKLSFVAKSGRERRNQDRQKARFLTKEEQERLTEMHAKKQVSCCYCTEYSHSSDFFVQLEEKELAKRLTAAERERKEREREEARHAREQQRLEDARRKEQSKSAERSQKERLRKNDKLRQQRRKEVTAEMRKNRAEASTAVLQFFDEEEEAEERAEHWTSSSGGGGEDWSSATSSGVASFLQTLPDQSDCLQLAVANGVDTSLKGGEASGAASVGADFDAVVQVSSTLHMFRRHLRLEPATASSLDQLLACFQQVSISEQDRAQLALRSETGSRGEVVEEAKSVSVPVQANESSPLQQLADPQPEGVPSVVSGECSKFRAADIF